MNFKSKSLLWIGMMLTILLVLVACGSSETDGNNEPNNGGNDNVVNQENGNDPANNENEEEDFSNRDPITLKAGVIWDENMFNQRLKEPIEEKFPYITMEYLHVDHFNREAIEEMFTAGENPDMFFTLSQSDIEYFRIDQDLTDLIEKYDINTDRINPSLFEALRAQDEQRRLLSWPYEDTHYVLMYNIDIFDTFGVEYPHDDFTWDELIQFSRQFNEERDGIEYRGLDIAEEVMLSQLSVNATDPDTGEVQILNNDAFSKYANMYRNFFDSIPNDYEGDIFTDHRFFGGSTAMVIINAQAIDWHVNHHGGLVNYDLAAVPTWEHLPGIGPRGFLHTFTLNPDTEHEEDVLRVFEYFSSDEYQEWMAVNGVGIVTNNEALQEKFFSNFESTEGKNIPAIFKNETATPPERISIYDQYVDFDLQMMYEENLDPNEFLRIVSEESEIKIEEAGIIE